MSVVLAVLLAGTPAAAAGPPPDLHFLHDEIICPVGGERFQATRYEMYSTYGARPDGRPYSDLPFPPPLPECPGNHLVMFDRFDGNEVARLPALIASAEYRRLAVETTPYYRAAWLATRLGRSEPQALELLQSAMWEATSDMPGRTKTAQLRRYQDEFVARVQALPPTTGADDRVWLQTRAANALRQMRRFVAAERMRQAALASAREATSPAGWLRDLSLLGGVISRHDDAVEPLDMVPDSRVAAVCAGLKSPNAFDRLICARPDVAARLAQFRAARARR